jgi:hypothetical protein
VQEIFACEHSSGLPDVVLLSLDAALVVVTGLMHFEIFVRILLLVVFCILVF